MTFGAAWTLKTELPPTRELNFHKIAEFRKIRKSTKKWSEKRPPGRGKNRLCDPICLRVGGLAAPAGTNMCLCGSTMQKTSTAGLSKTNKLVQDSKKTQKKPPESAQKEPNTKNNAQILREVARTQESIIDERRAPRKHKTGLRKKREERLAASYAETWEHPGHKNMCTLIAFKWGPSFKFYIYI